MKTSTATILAMLGLLLTMGGVGGIENSQDSDAMLTASMVSIVGLLMMYCGVIALRVSEYYDER
jgi:hypothetical protein